jgi:hypothetical protein
MSEPISIATPEMPLPMGIEEKTGNLLPPFDASVLARIDAAASEVLQRGATRQTDRLAVADVDPNNLTDAGWGIVFSSKADPGVRSALQPLIDARQSQVRDAKLFRVFEGKAGYEPGDTVRSWLAKSGVGFAVVDPLAGVPLYLTLIGGPEDIPFEFQYLLDTYWNVGRLAFDTPADYASYIARILAYETAPTVRQRRQVAIFATKNPSDRATALFHDQLATPLVFGEASSSRGPVGERQKFQMLPLLGPQATKQNLSDLMMGNLSGGPPALLLTGSHGDFLDIDEAGQRDRQGAIVCQDWGSGPVDPSVLFTAADVPAGAALDGLVHILFACYGGGCPEFDNFRSDGGGPRRIARQPFVARLPQRELLSGAMAVLAHIDRAWTYSFLVGRSVPQPQEFRDLMTRILKGDRVGQAADQFNLRWAVLSAELADDELTRQTFPEEVSDIVLANRWVARNDARNYILFGEPAVRLRVEAMA